jgi:catechol 2,3-dioxygenase-like lactoylglutathione lyase family enzyme
MYDHIGLKVKDLDAAVSFYRAALAPLGHVLASRDAANAGFGPPGRRRRQWQAGLAHGLQPDLLRGVPARSGRQQR